MGICDVTARGPDVRVFGCVAVGSAGSGRHLAERFRQCDHHVGGIGAGPRAEQAHERAERSAGRARQARRPGPCRRGPKRLRVCSANAARTCSRRSPRHMTRSAAGRPLRVRKRCRSQRPERGRAPLRHRCLPSMASRHGGGHRHRSNQSVRGSHGPATSWVDATSAPGQRQSNRRARISRSMPTSACGSSPSILHSSGYQPSGTPHIGCRNRDQPDAAWEAI